MALLGVDRVALSSVVDLVAFVGLVWMLAVVVSWLRGVVRVAVRRRRVRRERDRQSACAHRLLAIRPSVHVGVDRGPRPPALLPLREGEPRVDLRDLDLPETSSLEDDIESCLWREKEHDGTRVDSQW